MMHSSGRPTYMTRNPMGNQSRTRSAGGSSRNTLSQAGSSTTTITSASKQKSDEAAKARLGGSGIRSPPPGQISSPNNQPPRNPLLSRRAPSSGGDSSSAGSGVHYNSGKAKAPTRQGNSGDPDVRLYQISQADAALRDQQQRKGWRPNTNPLASLPPGDPSPSVQESNRRGRDSGENSARRSEDGTNKPPSDGDMDFTVSFFQYVENDVDRSFLRSLYESGEKRSLVSSSLIVFGFLFVLTVSGTIILGAEYSSSSPMFTSSLLATLFSAGGCMWKIIFEVVVQGQADVASQRRSSGGNEAKRDQSKRSKSRRRSADNSTSSRSSKFRDHQLPRSSSPSNASISTKSAGHFVPSDPLGGNVGGSQHSGTAQAYAETFVDAASDLTDWYEFDDVIVSLCIAGIGCSWAVSARAEHALCLDEDYGRFTYLTTAGTDTETACTRRVFGHLSTLFMLVLFTGKPRLRKLIAVAVAIFFIYIASYWIVQTERENQLDNVRGIVIQLVILISMLCLKGLQEANQRRAFEVDVQLLRKQRQLLRERDEFHGFLQKVLPPTLLRKVQHFEKLEVLHVDTSGDAVAVVASLADFTGYTSMRVPKHVAKCLAQFHSAATVATQLLGIDRIAVLGDTFIASLNLLRQVEEKKVQIDAIKFALQLAGWENGDVMRVGIHEGHCVGAIIGKSNIHYCMFGEAADVASLIVQNDRVAGVYASQHFINFLPRGTGTRNSAGYSSTDLVPKSKSKSDDDDDAAAAQGIFYDGDTIMFSQVFPNAIEEEEPDDSDVIAQIMGTDDTQELHAQVESNEDATGSISFAAQLVMASSLSHATDSLCDGSEKNFTMSGAASHADSVAVYASLFENADGEETVGGGSEFLEGAIEIDMGENRKKSGKKRNKVKVSGSSNVFWNQPADMQRTLLWCCPAVLYPEFKQHHEKVFAEYYRRTEKSTIAGILALLAAYAFICLLIVMSESGDHRYGALCFACTLVFGGVGCFILNFMGEKHAEYITTVTRVFVPITQALLYVSAGLCSSDPMSYVATDTYHLFAMTMLCSHNLLFLGGLMQIAYSLAAAGVLAAVIILNSLPVPSFYFIVPIILGILIVQYRGKLIARRKQFIRSRRVELTFDAIEFQNNIRQGILETTLPKFLLESKAINLASDQFSWQQPLVNHHRDTIVFQFTAAPLEAPTIAEDPVAYCRAIASTLEQVDEVINQARLLILHVVKVYGNRFIVAGPIQLAKDTKTGHERLLTVAIEESMRLVSTMLRSVEKFAQITGVMTCDSTVSVLTSNPYASFDMFGVAVNSGRLLLNEAPPGSVVITDSLLTYNKDNVQRVVATCGLKIGSSMRWRIRGMGAVVVRDVKLRSASGGSDGTDVYSTTSSWGHSGLSDADAFNSETTFPTSIREDLTTPTNNTSFVNNKELDQQNQQKDVDFSDLGLE